jgi:hypothetical protein
VSVVRLVAPAGVATGDASDRLLHSETVQARAPVLRRFPAQRPSRARPCGARSRVALVPEPLGSVPDHANVCFACCFARPETRAAGNGRLGAARCKTRPGRTALHGALLTSAPGRSWPRALSSLGRRSLPFASDTLVASSALVGVGAVRQSHAVARRPPRSVPRGPRERRAHSRSRVPSTVSRDAHSVRAEARTRPRRLRRARRSRDEDRRTQANRPPFAAGGLLRSRARAPPMVRLPFTRSVQRPGFRPDRYRWRASLSPRASCRFLQIRRRTGTHHEPRRFLVLRPGVTNLQPPSPSSAPSRGRTG